MRRAMSALAVLATLSVPTPSPAAQTVAGRVAGVRDGVVRMSFPTRAGVCGDGRFIGEETPEGFRMYAIWDGNYTVSTLDDVRPNCAAGPLRLVVQKRAGTIRELRAAVGVAWIANDRATDLGVVSAAEAAHWLLDVTPQLDDEAVRVALLAAAMAEDGRISARLMTLARDKAVAIHVRTRAMRWLVGAARHEGMEALADRAVREIASDEQDRLEARERAVRSLSSGTENDAFLRELYPRVGIEAVQERIIRRLGATRDAENARWVMGVARDDGSRLSLRDRALRVLGDEMGRSDLVREIYDRLTHPALQERALRVVTEHDGAAALPWLRQIAESSDGPLAVRERALRLLGETGDPNELRSLYSRLDHHALRDRVLRSVAERERSAAAPWLRDVMQDPTERRELRERAIRLLGELREMEVLQGVYRGLDLRDLRERVLRTVGEHASPTNIEWIESVALDPAESSALRERAVRVLAERRVETERLVRLYDRVDSHQLRDRLIRVFAERGDTASVAKLDAIVQDDPNSSLGRSAARRLADRTARGGRR